jgi:spore maturation protein CgeB
VPSVEEFFEEDKEIVCFDTKEEMVDKLHFYLAHDDVRIRIANSARERLIHNHTWHNRIEQISNILGHFINP